MGENPNSPRPHIKGRPAGSQARRGARDIQKTDELASRTQPLRCSSMQAKHAPCQAGHLRSYFFLLEELLEDLELDFLDISFL